MVRGIGSCICCPIEEMEKADEIQDDSIISFPRKVSLLPLLKRNGLYSLPGRRLSLLSALVRGLVSAEVLIISNTPTVFTTLIVKERNLGQYRHAYLIPYCSDCTHKSASDSRFLSYPHRLDPDLAQYVAQDWYKLVCNIFQVYFTSSFIWKEAVSRSVS